MAMQLNINQLEHNTADGVITTCHWTATDTDGTNTASVYGSVGFSAPDPAAFIPYNQVTQEQVMGWLTAKLDETYGKRGGNRNQDSRTGLEILQDQLTAQLAAQAAPKSATGFPWNATIK